MGWPEMTAYRSIILWRDDLVDQAVFNRLRWREVAVATDVDADLQSSQMPSENAFLWIYFVLWSQRNMGSGKGKSVRWPQGPPLTSGQITLHETRSSKRRAAAPAPWGAQ